MSLPTFWRAASIQFLAVLLLAGALGAALPRSFFEDWGWIAGPASWMLCAAITSWFVRLPVRLVLLGAALAGLPSLLAVFVGLHWAGALLAVVLFALWCGWLRAQLLREY
ncbi:MAG: hypothetical protein QOF06_437 [Solirubrobacterales bacterium]|jgi:hypothetical protein|nr:hypothetical protein [Solirubrobacterales bacterium]